MGKSKSRNNPGKISKQRNKSQKGELDWVFRFLGSKFPYIVIFFLCGVALAVDFARRNTNGNNLIMSKFPENLPYKIYDPATGDEIVTSTKQGYKAGRIDDGDGDGEDDGGGTSMPAYSNPYKPKPTPKQKEEQKKKKPQRVLKEVRQNKKKKKIAKVLG